jgi:hypothetical protein
MCRTISGVTLLVWMTLFLLSFFSLYVIVMVFATKVAFKLTSSSMRVGVEVFSHLQPLKTAL